MIYQYRSIYIYICEILRGLIAKTKKIGQEIEHLHEDLMQPIFQLPKCGEDQK
jgi:hypothetical protein